MTLTRNDRPGSRRATSPDAGYLPRLFRATEEENRQVVLSMLMHDSQARLLDLGCYDGALTSRLAQRIGTTDVTGVEVVPHIAEAARGRGIDVVSADLNGRIPLPDASFDVIHANQVIEHLWDTDTFASEIARLLRPDGYAVISTNNLASLHNVGSLLLGRQPPPAHVSNRVIVGNRFNPLHGAEHESGAMAHLRIFSYYGLREFLASYGLHVELFRSVGFYPLPVKLARLVSRAIPIYGAYITCRVTLTKPRR